MKFLSLRWKISGILVFSNIFLGLIILGIVNRTVTSSLETEVIERGKTIANDLARFSAELILEEDVIALRELITSSLAFESVQYILIQDADLNILSDTFNGNVPEELSSRTIDSEINQKKPQLINIASLNSSSYDIVYPVEEGSLGFIRVGMKQEYISEKVSQTNNYIILTVLGITLIGIIVVYFLANKIIKPILKLANRANEISRGKLEDKIEIRTNDEINHMAEAVERLRESLNIALARLDRNKTVRI
jgi:HAMP domain-containing protein